MWWSYARKPGVHEQRQRAAREGKRLAKERGKDGRQPTPVVIEGRTIARSFWGNAWCENLESYRDYEYRLPRGRSYLRNGAVLDLDVTPGKIVAVVSGTTLYDVEIAVQAIESAHWGLRGLSTGPGATSGWRPRWRSPVLLAPYRREKIGAPRAHFAADLGGKPGQLAQPVFAQCQIIGVADQMAESLELTQHFHRGVRQKGRTQTR